MNKPDNYRIKLYGYCSVKQEKLLRKFLQEGIRSLTNLLGEYVIVIKRGDECWIITSPNGVIQYYYTLHQGKLYHDDTVLKVLQKSGLSWSWNWKTLGDAIQLEHVLDNDTLHSQIFRMPATSILHYHQGSLKISSYASWEDLHPASSSSPEMALSAFNEEVERWAEKDLVLSMAGGFDSRVILSSLLVQDYNPLLVTMGFPDSTDVVISRQIADSLGLKQHIVSLKLRDYLQYGNQIVELTNGTKSAQHWHSYIYPKKANLHGNIFYVGTNGEFARSYQCDKGLLARMRNLNPRSLKVYWRKRLFRKPIFKRNEVSELHPEFRKEFQADERDERMKRLVDLYPNGFLPSLDRFWLQQKVRNFMGNGLKLYGDSVRWRAPFLSQDWVTAVWNLPYIWKFGSNWHRFCIKKNYPQLLNFPEPEATIMAERAALGYWLPSRYKKKYPQTPYARYSEWFQQDFFIKFMKENASVLSELINPKLVINIMREHKKKGNRTKTISWLLNMVFWLRRIKEYIQ